MRKLTSKSEADDLTAKDISDLLDEHIKYRVRLIQDAVSRIPCKSMQDNQAFEAGAVAGRVLLEFLGIGYSRKTASLRPSREYENQDGMTDDVKIIDVGGSFADIASIEEEDAKALCDFIQGTHKACAHLTAGSNHNFTERTFHRAATIILNTLEQCMPKQWVLD